MNRRKPQSNTLNSSNNFVQCIYYQNVNGLLSKKNQLQAEILAADFKIYVFTETALNDTITSSELFPNDFAVYRCDRSSKTSHKSSKGGVLIAVNKVYESDLMTTCEIDGCEQVWVKVKYKKKTW